MTTRKLVMVVAVRMLALADTSRVMMSMGCTAYPENPFIECAMAVADLGQFLSSQKHPKK